MRFLKQAKKDCGLNRRVTAMYIRVSRSKPTIWRFQAETHHDLVLDTRGERNTHDRTCECFEHVKSVGRRKLKRWENDAEDGGRE